MATPPEVATASPVATDQRELPPLTLRPPPVVAPPPAFTPSAPPFDFAALSLPPTNELASAGATETFRPSQVDRPLSLPPKKRSQARWLQAAAAVCALALGGGAWLELRPHSQPPRESRPTAIAARAALPEPVRAPQATVEAAPAPPAPAPEPQPDTEPAASAVAAEPAPTSDLASAFAAALAGNAPSGNAIAVTVRVTPAGSIIFDHGKRLGTDVVQVNIEPGGKKNLVALLDGYLPRRFTVDSSLNSVSIALRPQGLPTSSAPATYGTPSTPTTPSPTAAQPAPAAAAPRPVSAPPKTRGKKEAFDPSRDVGAL